MATRPVPAFAAAAAIAASYTALYGVAVSAPSPPAWLTRRALSLERLGKTGGGQRPDPTVLLTYACVHATGTQVAAALAQLFFLAPVVTMSSVPRVARAPGFALATVVGVSALVAGAAGASESLIAMDAWLSMLAAAEADGAKLPEELVGLGSRAQVDLSSAIGDAIRGDDDARLISTFPIYGSLPSLLGLASFATLGVARRHPLIAVVAVPPLATVLWAASRDPSDVPTVLGMLNSALGTTTWAMNATGVATGAVLWLLALRRGRRVGVPSSYPVYQGVVVTVPRKVL